MSSSKERQAKRRKRMKENKKLYDAYLEKDRKRKAERRATLKLKMSQSQLEELKVKERIRLKRYREKKKLEAEQCSATGNESRQMNMGTPYRSTQSLGKAVKRAQVSLPFSPRKKRCVIEHLAKRAGLEIVNGSPLSQSSVLRENTKSAVNDFYLSNDISWQAPGRKDRVIIREKNSEGQKVKRTEQTRYMLMSLKEAHFKFVEEHPNEKIGLSKFCEMRPPNVKLFDHIPHYVCMCSYHENVRFLLVALKEHTSLRVDFHEFISQVTCDAKSQACLTSQCKECKDHINDFTPSNGSDVLQYLQWQDTNNRKEKVEVIATVEDGLYNTERTTEAFSSPYVREAKTSSVFRYACINLRW